MKTIFGWFFSVVLSTFFFAFIFFNLYIFIIETYGYQYNLLGVPLENFRGGYFGFRSFFNALKYFPTNVVSLITQSLFNTFDALGGGIPRFLAAFSDIANFKVTEIFRLLATLVVQPLYLLVILISDIFTIVAVIVQVIDWVFGILAGAYNVSVEHTYPYPYIDVIRYFLAFR